MCSVRCVNRRTKWAPTTQAWRLDTTLQQWCSYHCACLLEGCRSTEQTAQPQALHNHHSAQLISHIHLDNTSRIWRFDKAKCVPVCGRSSPSLRWEEGCTLLKAWVEQKINVLSISALEAAKTHSWVSKCFWTWAAVLCADLSVCFRSLLLR